MRQEEDKRERKIGWAEGDIKQSGPTKPLPTLGDSEEHMDPQSLPHGICCHVGLWAESFPRNHPPFTDVIPRQEIITTKT